MFITIDMESTIPIYTQLVYQIKEGVLQGNIQPGTALPSVRSLASDIGINLHTVNKAYKLLAEEGIVVQEKKGFRIANALPMKMSDPSLALLKIKIKEMVIDSQIYGLNLDSLIQDTIKTIQRGERL